MNTELIQHYKRGIELIKKDIENIKLKIHGEQLCNTIKEVNLINKYEGYIIEWEEKIRKLQ